MLGGACRGGCAVCRPRGPRGGAGGLGLPARHARPASARAAAPCVIPQGCNAGYKGRGATADDFGPLLNAPHITFEPDYHKAFALAQKEPVVLCTGSFYLVGAVKELVKM